MNDWTWEPTILLETSPVYTPVGPSLVFKAYVNEVSNICSWIGFYALNLFCLAWEFYGNLLGLSKILRCSN